MTLPLIIAMQRGTQDQRSLIENAIQTGAVEELPAIVQIVKSTGALEATRLAAAAQAQQAIDAARQLPSNRYTEGLLELASQLLERRL